MGQDAPPGPKSVGEAERFCARRLAFDGGVVSGSGREPEPDETRSCRVLGEEAVEGRDVAGRWDSVAKTPGTSAPSTRTR